MQATRHTHHTLKQEDGLLLDRTRDAPRRRTSSSRRTGTWLALLTVLLLALALRRTVRNAVVVYSIAETRPPLPIRIYRRLFRYEREVADFDIPVTRHALRVRMYSPAGMQNPPVLVLVHGLAFQGVFNEGINFLGKRLAEGGFRVVIPQIDSERDLRMNLSGITDIGDTVHWTAMQYGRRPGVVGVSFAGGLVLAAAARPEYARDMKLVVVVSGYNSIGRLGRYYMGDTEQGPDGVRYSGPPPSIGPLLMAYQYLESMVPAEDVLPLRAAMATEFNEQTETPEGRQTLQHLTPQQQAELRAFLNGRSATVSMLEHEMMQREKVPLAAISPAGKLTHLSCPVYILHGLHDLVVPSGEAEWNAAELRRGGTTTHVLITTGMLHGMLDRKSRRLERAKVGFFLLRVLLATDSR